MTKCNFGRVLAVLFGMRKFQGSAGARSASVVMLWTSNNVVITSTCTCATTTVATFTVIAAIAISFSGLLTLFSGV